MAYSKQTWDTNSYVNPTRMNHIEDGIEAVDTKISENGYTVASDTVLSAGNGVWYHDITVPYTGKYLLTCNFRPTTYGNSPIALYLDQVSGDPLAGIGSEVPQYGFSSFNYVIDFTANVARRVLFSINPNSTGATIRCLYTKIG